MRISDRVENRDTITGGTAVMGSAPPNINLWDGNPPSVYHIYIYIYIYIYM